MMEMTRVVAGFFRGSRSIPLVFFDVGASERVGSWVQQDC
jgi:hypothetical protein